MMQRLMPLALVLALALGAGCRQADGPAPAPTTDQTNEIGDIARDLLNVAGNDAQAPEDLRSDLTKYAPDRDAAARVDELSREVSRAIAGTRLDERQAQELAHKLWLALTARQFSDRQVETLQKELKTILSALGITEDRAQPIVAKVSDVQKSITENPRRWYQVF